MEGKEQRVTVMFDGIADQPGDLPCFVCGIMGAGGMGTLNLVCNEKVCADEAVTMFGKGAEALQHDAMGMLKVGVCDAHSFNMDALASYAHDKGFLTREFIQKARGVVAPHRATVKNRCNSCGVSGVRKGKITGIAFLCRYCKGKGYTEIRYTPFESLTKVEGITEVLGCHSKAEQGDDVERVSYQEFLGGKIPKISQKKINPDE